jgi:uncharacterized protein (DUF488 family)
VPPNVIWTVGHSNRELVDFLALLTPEKVEAIADVRRFPGSRRYPHFGRDALSAALHDSGIKYIHFPDLGGRRTTRNNSTANAGWRVAAFAAFADYMLTDEFASAFEELANLARQSPTAIMCAEALPWRCHRRLIADQFVAHGWTVWDIVGPNQLREHSLPTFAKIVNGQLAYPG